jgi:hypothetical protein
MTAEQFAAFESDELDRSRIGEIMQELGIDLGGDFRGKAGDAGDGDGDGGGGFVGGGKGDGKGGLPGGGGDLTEEQQATRETFIESRGGGFRGSSFLIDAVITLLEGKTE